MKVAAHYPHLCDRKLCYRVCLYIGLVRDDVISYCMASKKS